MLPSIQILRTALLILLVTLAQSACREGATKDPNEEPRAPSGQFGDPYRIVNNFLPADPEVVPQFHQDTLVTKVIYAGGCKDHGFDLRSEVDSDTAKLWLTHDAHGDDCEAEVQDEIRQTVSQDVLNAPVVVLLDPNNGPPHIIRWGER